MEHLKELEHLIMHGYCEWVGLYDEDEGDQTFPNLSHCHNLKIVDISYIQCYGFTLRDIGLCKNLEYLHINYDDDDEIAEDIKNLPAHIRVVKH